MSLGVDVTFSVEAITDHTNEEIVNGDPYMAVLLSETETRTVPATKAVTLGTGFESLDGIARRLTAMLNDEEIEGLDFAPATAHLFSLTASVDLDHVSQIAEQEP